MILCSKDVRLPVQLQRAMAAEAEAAREARAKVRRCCNNCPRDGCPRRQLSKGLFSNDTVVQGDYCPMGLLSKEAFTSEKLAQIIFSYFLLEVTTFIDYRISKKIM